MGVALFRDFSKIAFTSVPYLSKILVAVNTISCSVSFSLSIQSLINFLSIPDILAKLFKEYNLSLLLTLKQHSINYFKYLSHIFESNSYNNAFTFIMIK